MKYALLKVLRLWALFALLVPVVALQAQDDPDDVDEDEIFELNPFVVEAGADEGYLATATLGGTRIRTDLRDLATPITAVTSQFLQDTASNNNQDLLTYTTNTEVGGLYGNWGGFGNDQGVSDRGALLQPDNNTRVRGLEQADNTRNFFLSDIPWDSYNVDRVEIQRGPNSILFGVGSPAGIINTTTISAQFDGNRGELKNQYSKYGSLRWSGDYNMEIVDDVLALRVAGVYDDQQFRQEPAFEEDQRFFATLSFEPQALPKDWAGKLVIRANAEWAEIEANRPRILPPEDGITLWFEDSAGDGANNLIGLDQAVVDMFLYNIGGGGDPYRGPLSNSDVLNPFYQPGTAQIDGGALNNGGIGFFWVNGARQPYFVSRQAPRVYPGALNADGGVDNAISIPYGSPLRVSGMNQYAIQIDRMDGAEGVPSRFPLAARGYYKDQSLTDETIFDFYDHLIDGDNKREFQEWDAYNFSIAQTFLDNRLGLEFVYDDQTYSQWREGATWNRPYISIDINKNLQHQLSTYGRVPDPSGENSDGLIDPSTYTIPGFTPTAAQPYVNPRAGSAFTAGSFSSNTMLDRERDTKRLTGFAEFRASDVFDEESWLAKLIGRHLFTGLYTKEERLERTTTWLPSATTYEWAYNLSVAGEVTKLGEATRGITPVIYLSEPLFGRSSASGLNLGPIDVYYNPSGVYETNYFDSTWNPPAGIQPGDPFIGLLGEGSIDPTAAQAQADNPWNYVGRTTAPAQILNADDGDRAQLITDYGVREQIVDSYGFVWQGYFLDGHIVPTVGWREDTLETYTATGAEDETGVVSTRIGELEKVLENTGETLSWGIVGHTPNSWLADVPIISGLSAYYNYGENNKVEARYNYDGEPLANPSAESVDYGVVLSAFEDRLTIKVGKYETKVKNGNLPGGGSLIGGNQYYLYQLEAWGMANTLLYAFGHAGLDPNQAWHWNWAQVDDPEIPYDIDPASDTFKNHPSTQSQLRAMDDFMAGADQQFFDNYAIPADVNALRSAYNTWRSTGDIQPLVAAANQSGFSVGTYTTGFSSQNNGQINGISPNGTIDNTSEGYEVEVNFRPVKNWNIQLNVSKTNAYRESLGQPMLDYIDGQWSRMQGDAGDIRLWWGGERTIRQFYEDNIISAVQFQEESIGFQVPELREWRYNLITNYSFTEGRLEGFNIGGGWRWEDEQILGYGLKDDESGLDVMKPFYGDTESHLDLWAGYQREIREGITWRIQVNFRNVGEDAGLTPISINPDGRIAAQRITEGMSWAITNSISF